MPANTYTLIEKIVVGAAGASSITFTSIPQTYTDLVVICSIRTTRAAGNDTLTVQLNSTNITGRRLYGDGSSAASDTTPQILPDGANATANTFSSTQIYIPNYASTSQYKSVSIDDVQENNATGAYQDMIAGIYSSNSAVTSITLDPDNGNLVQYSTFYLYGIAKEGVSPSPSSAPYATGGDSIVFDGTYWIHTFTSSGTFTPKKNLTCDYLVVAGGAGGGGGYGGGGGAGGLRSTVTATGGGGSLESALSLTANTGYTVTVGAGGAGGAAGYLSANGTNGSNSVFSSITSTGGGGGGNGRAGSNGGSGGGGVENAGGTGTTNQGYAGSAGTNSNKYGSGGGGGAGAAGGTAYTDSGGPGGNGVATSISGSSVTYAGGGGGGVYGWGTGGTAPLYGAGTGGTGGGGDAGRGETSNNAYNALAGSAGTANTGGGGGGASARQAGPAYTAAGGAGGSGIVIVRYAA